MKIQKGTLKDINQFAQSTLFDKVRKVNPQYDNWWEKSLNHICWYSLYENEIVAICIIKNEKACDCDFSTDEKRILKISLFIVSKKFDNRGLGKAMLEKVENYAIDNGLNDIYFSTKSTNEQAINFFIKNNYQILQIYNNEIYLQKRGLNNYIEINKKAFDSLSHEYKIRGNIKSGYEETPTYFVSNITNILPNNITFDVLEIGPGSGEIIEEFENRGHRTIAVELSSRVAYNAKGKSPRTIFLNSNIMDVSFLKEQFDIIYAGAIIHLFNESDAGKVLSKFYDWLKKTGVLFINTTISKTTGEGFYYKDDYNYKTKRYRRKWREEDFKSFIEKYFTIEKTLYTNEIDRQKVWIGFLCRKRSNEI